MTTLTQDAATPLSAESLDVLFAGAHTTHTFADQPVDTDIIRAVYEDLRWAPTMMNNQPLRLTVVESVQARQKLAPHMAEGNRAKTLAAPLTLIAAYDPRWHEHMTALAPHREGVRDQFEPKEELRHVLGANNGHLQIGYLLLALRAHGLHVGPMTGMDAAGIDAEFHAESGWKTLIVINVGHQPHQDDELAHFPRSARLNFDDAAVVL